jgi:hypothetical protein
MWLNKQVRSFTKWSVPHCMCCHRTASPTARQSLACVCTPTSNCKYQLERPSDRSPTPPPASSGPRLCRRLSNGSLTAL